MRKSFFLYLVVVLFLAGCVLRSPVQNRFSCKEHSDCVLVNEGCCGCNAGGKRISINRAFTEQHRQELDANCRDIACIQVISTHPSCWPVSPVCSYSICSYGLAK